MFKTTNLYEDYMAQDQEAMERLLDREYHEDLLMRSAAQNILKTGATTIGNRAKERDDAEQGERSMAATVRAFNAIYGLDLTETQGWMFMVFLKAARAKEGQFNLDDYIDGAAYFALAGESAAKS
jgi:hypothetical protein